MKLFFTALMFYTRIPIPRITGYSAENLSRATRWFPLVGAVVGGIGAAVFWLVINILSVQVATVSAMSVMILTTGAFHEDAFGDFCDGFGGGYTPDKILEIMKDSRIGTYGTVGLIMLLLLKFILISSLPTAKIPVFLISGAVFSRTVPVILIFTLKYVRDDEKSKSKPIGKKSSVSTLIIALVTGVASLILIPSGSVVIMLPLIASVFLYFRHYVKKKLGGYTGDVLGALQQIAEVTFFIAMLLNLP